MAVNELHEPRVLTPKQAAAFLTAHGIVVSERQLRRWRTERSEGAPLYLRPRPFHRPVVPPWTWSTGCARDPTCA